MTALILIRHGETDWNVEGRYQGQADPPLNASGRHQACMLAKELRGVRLDVMYTSPLRRAAETAEIVAAALNLPLHAEPRLMEIHQGDWQTRLRSDIQALYPDLFRRWETEPWQVTPPGGERLSQVQARVEAALDEILTRHPDGRVGLVIHRMPIALIKMRYQGLDPDIVRSIHLPNIFWEEILINEKG